MKKNTYLHLVRKEFYNYHYLEIILPQNYSTLDICSCVSKQSMWKCVYLSEWRVHMETCLFVWDKSPHEEMSVSWGKSKCKDICGGLRKESMWGHVCLSEGRIHMSKGVFVWQKSPHVDRCVYPSEGKCPFRDSACLNWAEVWGKLFSKKEKNVLGCLLVRKKKPGPRRKLILS